MGAGDSWTNPLAISSAKLNKMTKISGTGAYLAGLSKVANQLKTCESTGSGYTLDHMYLTNTAADTDTDITGGPHTHTSSSDGGLFTDVVRSNQLVGIVDKRSVLKSAWQTTASGTAAAVNDTNGSNVQTIDLVTGTDTTGVAMIQIGGPLLDWTKKAVLKVKCKLSAATNVTVKIGVDINKAGTANTNTKQFGMEWCDSSGANWQIHTADGTTNSNTDTNIALTTNLLCLTALFDPTVPQVDAYVDSTHATSPKTTNIPTTGSLTNEDSIIKISVANGNGGSASRTLSIYSAWLAYTISDTNWPSVT